MGLIYQLQTIEKRFFLSAKREGDISEDHSIIEHLVRSYVEFSGHSFPYILVPLMQQHNVMINTARPLSDVPIYVFKPRSA